MQNGTLNLETGTLQAHRREDYLTKIIPVAYDPQAQCSLFLRFLHDIMGGDADMVRYLQRAIGYSLTADVREHALFILYGTGANGKSTLMEVLRELLCDEMEDAPGYAVQTPADTLLARKDEGPRSDLVRLRGARLVTAVETDAGRRMATALVKQLTGGDPITARALYRDFETILPTWKVWLGTNHKPDVPEHGAAMWRRIKLLPFNVTFHDPEPAGCPPKEGVIYKDKTLAAKLRTELPGVLAWAVEGCLAWQRDGLGDPPAVQLATAQYRAETDLWGNWIAESCVEGPDKWALARDLLASAITYAEANNERPPTQTKLGLILADRRYERSRARTRGEDRNAVVWLGIGLLKKADPTTPHGAAPASDGQNPAPADKRAMAQSGAGLDETARGSDARRGVYTPFSGLSKDFPLREETLPKTPAKPRFTVQTPRREDADEYEEGII